MELPCRSPVADRARQHQVPHIIEVEEQPSCHQGVRKVVIDIGGVFKAKKGVTGAPQ
jgi:hypothetical protein